MQRLQRMRDQAQHQRQYFELAGRIIPALQHHMAVGDASRSQRTRPPDS